MTKNTDVIPDPQLLLSVRELQGYHAGAKDGSAGKIQSFLFDDLGWLVRYLLVKTGAWFGREVLISPGVVTGTDWQRRTIHFELTKQLIKDSPPVDVEMPVSRQQEVELARHYSWPVYWNPLTGSTPVSMSEPDVPAPPDEDNHLRSSKEVIGYNIEALDGGLGRVADFVLDTNDWKVRWVVVDTRNWLPGRKVLTSTDWVTKIDWANRTVFVDLEQAQIKSSPEYDPRAPVNRHYEERLYDYYGRPTYW